jgi:tRNA nucleotidyltransferase (CCA-adding enzyme)
MISAASATLGPARILRAVRFEQRFDFTIEKNTLGALREAVKARMLERVQKHRLRDEILLILKEMDPLKALERLHQLTGFSFISPGLCRQQSWRREFRAAAKAMAAFKVSHPKRHVEPEAFTLALFLARLPYKEAKAVMLDFAFHRAVSARVLSLVQHRPGIQRELSRVDVRPSAAHRLLAPLSAEVVLLVSVLSGSREVQRQVAHFLDGTSGLCAHLKGEDLKALGLKPGPRYKEILRGLLSARIDGELSGRDEEIAWVRAVLHDNSSTLKHSPR